MDDVPADLLAAALDARGNTYCPYSDYQVGAALRTASGNVYVGCNVENAAYPEGVCAEGGTISAMVLGGDREIAEVVVVTGGESPGTPCGGCRQKLREFASPELVVHCTTVDGGHLRMTLAELLPASFGPEFLGSDPD